MKSIKDRLYTFKAICTNVVDGDTVDIMLDCGFKIIAERRVRLLEVDTPERGQENFKEATEFTKSKVLDKEIYVQTYKDDAFGRYLATIFYEENGVMYCLNDELKKSNLLKKNSRWNKWG